MDLTIHILIVLGLVACTLLGFVLTLLAMPGMWLPIGMAMVVQMFRPETFSGWTLVAVLGLGILAEILELVASGVGAKRMGGSKRAMFSAVVGAIVGAIVGTVLIPIPVVGTIVGGIVGAGVSALGAEMSVSGRTIQDAARVGAGAAAGRAAAMGIKLAFSGVIGTTLVVAAAL